MPWFLTDDWAASSTLLALWLFRALASPQQGQDTWASDHLLSLLTLLLFCGHQPPHPETTQLSALSTQGCCRGGVKPQETWGRKWPREAPSRWPSPEDGEVGRQWCSAVLHVDPCEFGGCTDGSWAGIQDRDWQQKYRGCSLSQQGPPT